MVTGWRTWFMATLLVVTMLLSGCDVPGQGLAQDAERYVKEMGTPVARLGDWVGKVRQLYSDIPSGDPIATACTSGRITALIDEGNGVVAGLRAVEPPVVIAPTHRGVADRSQRLVDKLNETRTLLCERGDVAAAKGAIEDVGDVLEDVATWVGRLSSWIREQ